jgi:hypothetical protein
MYKLVSAVISLMTAASGLIVIGVVLYSIVLAINDSAAPRGEVQITEIAAPEELPVFADAKDETPARSPVPL